MGGALGIFGSSKFGKARYLSTLRMMYDLLQKARRGGMLTIETDVEKPEESPVFQPYPEFVKNHHLRDFVCDTMRMVITGGVDAFDMDQMMDLDMEVQHQGEEEPVTALSTMADSLPGLGIVAAVLGVVITMGALGGPAEEIGHKVAAALVGTFLGILLCYGLVGPVAQNMAKATAEEHAFLYVLRVLMLAFIRGQPPVVAIEVGRRAIPSHVRPSFAEVEEACRNQAAAAPAKDAVE
jgi:chemotaxis protein MotA